MKMTVGEEFHLKRLSILVSLFYAYSSALDSDFHDSKI